MIETLPPYVLVARIASILGMSFALAIGLLLLLGGFVIASLLALAFFVPSLAIMVYAERLAAPQDEG